MIKFYVPGFSKPNKADDRYGDAQILSDGTYNLVIDGYERTGSDKLISYLKAQKMTEVYLMVSHWHYDHYHGIELIIKDPAFKVVKLYCPDPEDLNGGLNGTKWSGDVRSEKNAGDRIVKEAKVKGAEVVFLGKGDTVEIGKIRFKVFQKQQTSLKSDDTHAWAFMNSGSLCCYFPDLYYLTTGDGPDAIKDAADYFNAPIKWFKIPHHGNNCNGTNSRALKARGAVLAWYNGLEPKGVGTTAFTAYGARRCKEAGITVWDAIGNISGTADNGKLTLEHNGATIGIAVPYNNGGGSKVPTMNGIDIASYQGGIDLTKVPGDFVIIKATQGTGYVNPYCNAQYASAKKAGKLVGLYHYAGGSGAVAEADYFVRNIENYIGEAVLVLDWEAVQNSAYNKNMVAYCKTWLDRVYEKTGVRPLIYMSQSVTNSFDWSSVAKNYGLWVARYANNAETGYKDTSAYGKVGAWPYPAIFQYTSNGKLSGWSGRLDLNIAYMDKAAWGKYAAGDREESQDKTESKAPTGSVLELAADVMSGKYGSGEARKKALGSKYDEVQGLINHIAAASISTLAKETIAGKYGNEELRKRVLGSKYAAVQAAVNKLLG